MDRTAFVAQFRALIQSQVIGRLGSRLSPDPHAEAASVHAALSQARAQTGLDRAAFIAAIEGALSALFCDWQRGKRIDAEVMAGVVFDALRRAGATVSMLPGAMPLPPTLIDALGLKPGDELNVVCAADGAIAVEKVDQRVQALRGMSQRRWALPNGANER